MRYPVYAKEGDTFGFEYRTEAQGSTISNVAYGDWIDVNVYRYGTETLMVINGVGFKVLTYARDFKYVGFTNYYAAGTAGYITDIDDISFRELDADFDFSYLVNDDVSALYTAGKYVANAGNANTFTNNGGKIEVAGGQSGTRIIAGEGYTDFSLTFNLALKGDATGTARTSDSTGFFVRAKEINGSMYGYQINVSSAKQIWLSRVDGVTNAAVGTKLLIADMGAYGKDVTVKGVGDTFIITYLNAANETKTMFVRDNTYLYGNTGLRVWTSAAIGGVSITVKDYKTYSNLDTNFDALTEAKLVGDDGKVLRSAVVDNGATFAGEIDGNYIGIERDGGIYSTYSVVVDGDTTVTALSAKGLQLIAGASARLTDYSGLRFETNVSTELYNKLAGLTVQYGAILLPTELLEGELTVDLEIAKVVPSSGPFFVELEDVYKYRTTLYDIPEAEYATAVSARSYLTVTLTDGEVRTVYTDYNEADNSRSIKQVAETILGRDDLTTKYDESEIALLQKFAGVVAE